MLVRSSQAVWRGCVLSGSVMLWHGVTAQSGVLMRLRRHPCLLHADIHLAGGNEAWKCDPWLMVSMRPCMEGCAGWRASALG